MSVNIFSPFKKLIREAKSRRKASRADIRKVIPEISDSEVSVLRQFSPFTMTSVERQWALVKAVKYVDAEKIPGDFVECGVWRGGNVMIAKTLSKGSPVSRKFYLFDTFAGMSAPTDADKSHTGHDASVTFKERVKADHVDWVYASLEDVRANFQNAGLIDESVVFVKGKVEDTLKESRNLPDKISILRLDTDFYESTRAELEILYPRLQSGGILIVDDYGHWRGARQAVDEYFKDSNLLMFRIDYTARMMIKK